MNKKIFKGMSMVAMATVITSVLSVPAFAAVNGYVVKDKNTGEYYVYDYNKLKESYLDNKNKEEAPLFLDYMKYDLVAVEDDKAGFIDIEMLKEKYQEDKANFDIDKESENAKEEFKIQIDKIGKKEVNESGEVGSETISIKDREKLKEISKTVVGKELEIPVADMQIASKKLGYVTEYVNGLMKDGVTATVMPNAEEGKYDVTLKLNNETITTIIEMTLKGKDAE